MTFMITPPPYEPSRAVVFNTAKKTAQHFKVMTQLKKVIFSIFGMALLATGFVACSSDDSTVSTTVINFADCMLGEKLENG